MANTSNGATDTRTITGPSPECPAAKRTGAGLAMKLRLPKEMVDEASNERESRKSRGLTISHGYKLAYLSLDEFGNITFASIMFHGYRYGVDASAQCLFHRLQKQSLVPAKHRPPAPHCHCGFYALSVRTHLGKNETRSFGNRDPGNLVTLEVDLGGIIIPYEIGFRAEQIRVLSVSIPSFCFFCRHPAEGLIVCGDLIALEPMRYIQPCCNKCSPLVYPISWVRERLQTEVQWSQPANA